MYLANEANEVAAEAPIDLDGDYRLEDVINKTGEVIANMYADEYGNGVVYAGNRKGIGNRK